MWSHGTFYWNELMTRDPERAMRFYGATLGWTFSEMEAGGGGQYWVASLGEQPVAGVLPLTSPEFDGAPECWFPYVAVDDLDARLARATAEGGQVIKPPFDVPGVGRIAILSDATGVMMGWMTPSNE